MVERIRHIHGPGRIDCDTEWITETACQCLAAVAAVDDGKGVIVLTDMFGGTPSNLAISIMNQANVEVIAGVNLPMLVKLASVRVEKPLAMAVQGAQEAGRKYINVASQVLAGQ